MSARTSTPRYLLDTNICIYIINRKPPEVFRHFEGLSVGDIAISSITGAELAHGVAKSGSPRNQQALEKFLMPLDILAFDTMAMHHYGRLRTQLERLAPPHWSAGHLDRSSCAGPGLHARHQQPPGVRTRARPAPGELGAGSALMMALRTWQV